MILLPLLLGCVFISDADDAKFRDGDGDGLVGSHLGGPDCDDADSGVGRGTPLWRDADGDGWGDPATMEDRCAPGDGWVDNDYDCDDADAARGLGDQLWADADGDSFGDAAVSAVFCSATDGYVANGDDCDDTDPEMGGPLLNYLDADGDGWGTAAETLLSCTWETGYSTNAKDCNDGDAAISPAAFERCTDPEVDHDCDGRVNDCDLLSAGVVLLGGVDDAHAGTAAATLGDVDGDGYAEVAVGVPDLADGGRVHIVAGTPHVGQADDFQTILLADAARYWDGVPGDRAGAALVSGDFDGDGRLDLAIGQPGADAVTGGPISGQATVLQAPYTVGLQTAQATLQGEAPGDAVASVLAAGDRDGDGNDDLLLTAATDIDEGWVYLVPGPFAEQVILAYTPTEGGTKYVGPTTGGKLHLGAALGFADLDGDGSDEVLLGAPGLDDPRTDAGGVYVCDGEETGEYAVADCDGLLVGGVQGDAAGSALATGDLDEDGTIDVVVGAPGADDGVDADVGAVYILYGDADGFPSRVALRDDADTTLIGETVDWAEAQGRAGSALTVPGDVDGNGGDDLVVGAPGLDDSDQGSNVGGAYFLFGPMDRGEASLATANDRQICLYGTVADEGWPGCAAGTALAAAGDFDGDGLADTLVGAPGWYGNDLIVGATAVVFGSYVW